jgi:hypothetical protein
VFRVCASVHIDSRALGTSMVLEVVFRPPPWSMGPVALGPTTVVSVAHRVTPFWDPISIGISSKLAHCNTLNLGV